MPVVAALCITTGEATSWSANGLAAVIAVGLGYIALPPTIVALIQLQPTRSARESHQKLEVAAEPTTPRAQVAPKVSNSDPRSGAKSADGISVNSLVAAPSPPVGKDLVIRPSLVGNQSFSFTYEVNGEILLQNTIAQEYVARVSSGITSEQMRIRVRYGGNAILAQREMARQFSDVFLPREVMEHLTGGHVARIRIMAEASLPFLPWELAYDGSRFLAAEITVLNCVGIQKSEQRFTPTRSALIVEAIPDLFGVQPTRFLPDTDSRILKSGAQITRTHVHGRDELLKALSSSPFDLICINFHSTINKQGKQVIILRDGEFDLAQLASSFSGLPEVMVLDACETGMRDRTISYADSSAFQASIAMSSGYVLGVIGWLGAATAQRFENLFCEHYLRLRDVEKAVIAVRQELLRENYEDWWRYSLFGAT